MQLIHMPTNLLVFVVSLVFPMFGQGGGAVYVPLFNSTGYDFYTSVALSQLLIFFSALTVVFVYHRARLISWPLFLLIELPTILGAFFGGVVSYFIPTEWARVFFIILVSLSGTSMFFGWVKDSSHSEFDFKEAIREKGLRFVFGAAFMFFAGAMAGLLGIGGGIIKVPVMVLFLGIPVKIAAATSGLMVGFTAISGLLGHRAVGHIVLSSDVLVYVLTVIVGSAVGARVGVRLDRRRFRRYIGALLLAVALFYLFAS